MTRKDKPKRGDIALCKKGILGLILRKADNGYEGIRVDPQGAGAKWTSKEPKVIGLVTDVDEFLDIMNGVA
jgi:hypothetical protein